MLLDDILMGGHVVELGRGGGGGILDGNTWDVLVVRMSYVAYPPLPPFPNINHRTVRKVEDTVG